MYPLCSFTVISRKSTYSVDGTRLKLINVVKVIMKFNAILFSMNPDDENVITESE